MIDQETLARQLFEAKIDGHSYTEMQRNALWRLAWAEAKKQLAAPPAAPSPPPAPDRPWDGMGFESAIPEAETGTSLAVSQVNALWDQTSIAVIFDRIVGKKRLRGHENRSRGEVTISCPSPDHADKHPSASMNIDRGVWTCYACGLTGTDKLAMAGLHYGYPVPIRRGAPDAWEIKVQVVKALFGFDYLGAREQEARSAARVSIDKPAFLTSTMTMKRPEFLGESSSDRTGV